MLPLLLAACVSTPPADPGVLVVVQEQQPAWIRNFNPLNATTSVRWPTRSGIYEPLAIYNAATTEWEPWLAEGFAYEGEQTLTFDLREGVRWSDGTAFTARDVKFTFDLLLERRELDLGGVGKFLDRVEARGDDTVVFHLSRPYSPGLADIAHMPILPEHVWKDIEEPLAWANPDPVGTGPFTEVRVFRPQVFELGRNPYYWQPLGIEALRFPAMSSNDQVTMALLNGEIDWAGAFVPAIDRIYVGRDPEHNHYWFPLMGETIFLYPNTTVPPLDDARVRKALSLAIDRELVVKVAMYDTTRPADGTGLSDVHADWRGEEADSDWVTYDPERARALLDEAGFRPGPDGTRMVLEMATVSGWSDWVRGAQVIARNLRDVGVDVRVRGYDFGAWFELLGRGEFELTMSWVGAGVTPYPLYWGLMSRETVAPVGELAPANWHRFGSAEADRLLERFERTTDRAEQGRIVGELQALFAREAPAIPLFPSPSWGEFRSERFTGFPTAEDPYARLSPNHHPDPLLVMTRVRSR